MENPNVQPPQEEKKQERKATESYYPVQPPSRRGYYTVIAVILMLTVAALYHLDCRKQNVVPILTGGNMDIITMSSLVQNGLINRGRVFTFSVQLPDRPGELVHVAQIVAERQGNIIKLEHNQFVNINRQHGVELRVTRFCLHAAWISTNRSFLSRVTFISTRNSPGS